MGPAECLPHHRDAVQNALDRSVFYNPDAHSIRLWHQFDLANHVGRGKRCGYSFFELDRLTPAEVHQANCLDLVFASSAWAASVMRESGVNVPIVVATPGVDLQVFHPRVRPAWPQDLGPPPNESTTVFLNSGKWSVQKGMDILLDAFHAAFRPDDDVLLVMACFHPLRSGDFDGPEESAKWESFYLTSPLGRAGKIRVLPRRLASQYELAALDAVADAGVFLSRGEGWGLGAAELAAMGKQLILSDHSAHTDYGTYAGAVMVPVDGVEEAEEWPFLPRGRGNWARLGPDFVAAAAVAMREVYDRKRSNGRELNQLGISAFTERFTWAGCARTMAETLGVAI